MHLPIVLDNHVCERYFPLFVLIYLTTKKNKKKKGKGMESLAEMSGPIHLLSPAQSSPIIGPIIQKQKT